MLLRRSRFVRLSAALISLGLIVYVCTAYNIYHDASNTADIQADAAVVLGATVWEYSPSPVFKERINHAIDLYKRGKVRKLIFTGGQDPGFELSEGEAAEQYALQNGVPQGDILIESESQTTYQNLYSAQRLAQQHRLSTLLIVSDPLHMRRAMLIARDVGMNAYPSPTPTTRYNSLRSKTFFLARETFLYITYLVFPSPQP